MPLATSWQNLAITWLREITINMEEFLEMWRNKGIDVARAAAISQGWNMSQYSEATGKIVNTWTDGKDRNLEIGSTEYRPTIPQTNQSLKTLLIFGIAGIVLFGLMKRRKK